MIADFHVHTAFSDDSDYPMEQVVRDACSLGVDELCFTEHVDYGARAGRETLTEDDYEDEDADDDSYEEGSEETAEDAAEEPEAPAEDAE